MCGIAGFVDFHRSMAAGRLHAVAADMACEVRHRGPDGHGVWIDERSGVALGHRRLAIIDLSPSGDEPMVSADGRYVLVFNGEIYNHWELRRELTSAGISYRGHCDAETLLEAIAHWGLRRAVERADGMFALAVWDREEWSLSLARDRFGEKPLYFGWDGGHFLFASELKSLRAFPGFDPEIDRDAVALFLRHNYVPAPRSIYEGIHKLPPATTLTVRSREAHQRPQPEPYWSLSEVVLAGVREPFEMSEDELISDLDALLTRTVESRMLSDAPLGAFLSGGIDSSLVVALMQKVSDRPVRTFTIGVHDRGFDEARYAARIANHLGTDHTELYVTRAEVLEVVPTLPRIYDEPFADSSQIPTILVSDLASNHVKVALSGDGGDEVFAGYVRYQFGQDVWEGLSRTPLAVRRMIAKGIRAMAPSTWDAAFRRLAGALPRRIGYSHPGEKLHKLADVMVLDEATHVFQRLTSFWEEPAALVQGARPESLLSEKWGGSVGGLDFVDWMMYVDSRTYLPDDILTKVDRASMSRSLEVRVPFLSPALVEFAWRLPRRLKIRDGRGKVAPRQVLERYVPAELVERPKHGFGVPIGDWLRGPLRDWAEAYLSVASLESDGIFNAEPIRLAWREHLAGTRDRDHHLWSVLMFQAWSEENRS